MIESYCNSFSKEFYIENFVNNENLKTIDELEESANKSLNELKERYHKNIKNYMRSSNIHIISTYEYIKNNYKNKLLFHSMNHPSKYVIQYICEEINKLINIEFSINYDIDMLANPKCIIYKCIQKVVNFDINKHLPRVNDKNNINDITELYYDTYKNIGYNNS